jgi:hypothetical protein
MWFILAILIIAWLISLSIVQHKINDFLNEPDNKEDYDKVSDFLDRYGFQRLQQYAEKTAAEFGKIDKLYYICLALYIFPFVGIVIGILVLAKIFATH